MNNKQSWMRLCSAQVCSVSLKLDKENGCVIFFLMNLPLEMN
jgi:hypothetical protein